MNGNANSPNSICAEVGLLTADEISSVLQVSTKTLTTWRWKRRGPPSIKLGKKVFYLMVDFAEWMKSEAAKQKRAAESPPRKRVVRSKPLPASSGASILDA